jgi:hypothetical protein
MPRTTVAASVRGSRLGVVAAGLGVVPAAPAITGYAPSYKRTMSRVMSMLVEANRIGVFCAEESRITVKLFSRAYLLLRPIFYWLGVDGQIPYSSISSDGTRLAGLALACQKAGITGVTWYTFRHTFASRLLDRGVDIVTVEGAAWALHRPGNYALLAPESRSKGAGGRKIRGEL